jgi:hypothetical protein
MREKGGVKNGNNHDGSRNNRNDCSRSSTYNLSTRTWTTHQWNYMDRETQEERQNMERAQIMKMVTFSAIWTQTQSLERQAATEAPNSHSRTEAKAPVHTRMQTWKK